MYDKELVQKLQKQNLTVFEEVYQLRLEIVRGCNLDCWHCGRSRLKTEFMSAEIMDKILNEITSRCKRVEFAGQGEATLHPHLADFVRATRERLPKAQISTYTNSMTLRKVGLAYLAGLFEAGMNIIHVDLYHESQKDWFYQELKSFEDTLRSIEVQVLDFYSSDEDAWRFKGPVRQLIIAEEWEGFNVAGKSTRDPHNFAGNLELKHWEPLIGMGIEQFPLQRVCTEPLKYMTIGSNGDVYACCTDGAKALVVGNVCFENLQDIWQGDKLQCIRMILKMGHRKYLAPCSLCNCRSYRIGLYPYWGRVYESVEALELVAQAHRLDQREPLFHNLKAMEPMHHIKLLMEEAENEN